MHKIIVICGPTAVGKTKYAISVSKKYNGEIVSCDSMQLYKYMTIGSAKPTELELKEVPHHLVDIIDPRDDFSVSIYRKMALESISDISNRGKCPVISGGTGLYLNSILYDMDFSNETKNDELRSELEKLTNEELYERLVELNKESANRIHVNNRKKLIRAIECNGLDDFKLIEPNKDIDPILICLMRNREELYNRINLRVDQMVTLGLFDEVESLTKIGLTSNDISMKGIGYKEVIDYFNGLCSYDEAIELIKKNTRHYAKRQITWFKRYKEMNFLNIDYYKDEENALKELYNIINKKWQN